MSEHVTDSYHSNACESCAALRAGLDSPTALVYHCSEHGPWVSRDHSIDECPACVRERPLPAWLVDALKGATH